MPVAGWCLTEASRIVALVLILHLICGGLPTLVPPGWGAATAAPPDGDHGIPSLHPGSLPVLAGTLSGSGDLGPGPVVPDALLPASIAALHRAPRAPPAV